jgi:hypothetical protein
MDKSEGRRALKAFTPQARRIVNKVDPLRLIQMGAPKDEYDSTVNEAARLLVHGVSDLDVRLNEFIRRQYDLTPERADMTKLAQQLRAAWDQARARGKA